METTGRTVAEATESALDELGVDEADAEIVVVEDGRAGIFGLLRADARVRARVRPAPPRPKRTQRNRRRSGREGGRDANRPPSAPAERGSGPAAPRHEDGEVTAGAASSRRRRRGGGGGGQSTLRPPRPPSENRPAGEEPEMTIEQQAELAQSFVSGLVERFGLAAGVTVATEEGEITVEVTGEDLGLLVGQRGATLDALQELTRTVVQRRTDEHTARLTVDVAGFRQKRAAALEQFARQIATGVLESGEAYALEAMSAADRKIVHDAINDVEGVSTTSEGVEPRRYVVIRPDGAHSDE
ncbi:MAG TPA: RNA-binding cell elongation regulator Jag/EloR [Acidimicrobiales bacterium]|nr:RNA-binding cell elongation regulator Jag/EloR [Acidimicrobiales bacterium]